MFDIVDVKFRKFSELRTLIEQNGGVVGSSIDNRIKFTSAEMFLFREANCKCWSDNCPMHFALVYDVKFIKDCVSLQCLFDASLYSINQGHVGNQVSFIQMIGSWIRVGYTQSCS